MRLADYGKPKKPSVKPKSEKEIEAGRRFEQVLQRLSCSLSIGWSSQFKLSVAKRTEELRWRCADASVQQQASRALLGFARCVSEHYKLVEKDHLWRHKIHGAVDEAVAALASLLASTARQVYLSAAAACMLLAAHVPSAWSQLAAARILAPLGALLDDEDVSVALDAAGVLEVTIPRARLRPGAGLGQTYATKAEGAMWQALEQAGPLARIFRQLAAGTDSARKGEDKKPPAARAAALRVLGVLVDRWPRTKELLAADARWQTFLVDTCGEGDSDVALAALGVLASLAGDPAFADALLGQPAAAADMWRHLAEQLAPGRSLRVCVQALRLLTCLAIWPGFGESFEGRGAIGDSIASGCVLALIHSSPPVASRGAKRVSLPAHAKAERVPPAEAHAVDAEVYLVQCLRATCALLRWPGAHHASMLSRGLPGVLLGLVGHVANSSPPAGKKQPAAAVMALVDVAPAGVAPPPAATCRRASQRARVLAWQAMRWLAAYSGVDSWRVGGTRPSGRPVAAAAHAHGKGQVAASRGSDLATLGDLPSVVSRAFVRLTQRRGGHSPLEAQLSIVVSEPEPPLGNDELSLLTPPALPEVPLVTPPGLDASPEEALAICQVALALVSSRSSKLSIRTRAALEQALAANFAPCVTATAPPPGMPPGVLLPSGGGTLPAGMQPFSALPARGAPPAHADWCHLASAMVRQLAGPGGAGPAATTQGDDLTLAMRLLSAAVHASLPEWREDLISGGAVGAVVAIVKVREEAAARNDDSELGGCQPDGLSQLDADCAFHLAACDGAAGAGAGAANLAPSCVWDHRGTNGSEASEPGQREGYYFGGPMEEWEGGDRVLLSALQACWQLLIGSTGVGGRSGNKAGTGSGGGGGGGGGGGDGGGVGGECGGVESPDAFSQAEGLLESKLPPYGYTSSGRPTGGPRVGPPASSALALQRGAAREHDTWSLVEGAHARRGAGGVGRGGFADTLTRLLTREPWAAPGVRWWAARVRTALGLFGFPSAMGESFRRLLGDADLADIVFQLSDGRSIYAHKVVLAARCPALLVAYAPSTPDLPDSPPGCGNQTRRTAVPAAAAAATAAGVGVTVAHLSPRVSYEAFQRLLEYVYAGCVEIPSSGARADVALLAKKCGLEPLSTLLQPGRQPLWGAPPTTCHLLAALSGEPGRQCSDVILRPLVGKVKGGPASPRMVDGAGRGGGSGGEDVCPLALACATGGAHVHAHRAVLAAQSEYFCALFRSGMRDSVRGASIEIPVSSTRALVGLVRFLYSGTLSFQPLAATPKPMHAHAPCGPAQRHHQLHQQQQQEHDFVFEGGGDGCSRDCCQSAAGQAGVSGDGRRGEGLRQQPEDCDHAPPRPSFRLREVEKDWEDKNEEGKEGEETEEGLILCGAVQLCQVAERWMMEDLREAAWRFVGARMRPGNALAVLQEAARCQQWLLVERSLASLAPYFAELRASGALEGIDAELEGALRAAHVKLWQLQQQRC